MKQTKQREEKARQENLKLQEEVEQQRLANVKKLEQIEKLKFQQDVSTGLCYFDLITAQVRQSKNEVELLRHKYEQNLRVL